MTILLDGLPGVFLDFNTFVYFDRINRNRRVSPDLYVALGVDTVAIRERHGYLIWEVGKPPRMRSAACKSNCAPTGPNNIRRALPATLISVLSLPKGSSIDG